MAACAGGVFVGTHELPLVADNAGQSNRLNGALDGGGLWPWALTEQESSQLWNGGQGFEPDFGPP